MFWVAFINNGQTCAALKRLYVPDAIYDQVIDSLAAFTANMPTGAGLDEGNVLGPLQNQMQWNVVNRLVEDAKRRGARVVMGGDPDTGQPGFFYPKTLITDIDNDAPLVQEEQFGPALPIIRYTDLEQAISGRTASTSALAPRSGPPTGTRPRRSPRGSRPAPSGLTVTAASTPWSRSAAQALGLRP